MYEERCSAKQLVLVVLLNRVNEVLEIDQNLSRRRQQHRDGADLQLLHLFLIHPLSPRPGERRSDGNGSSASQVASFAHSSEPSPGTRNSVPSCSRSSLQTGDSAPSYTLNSHLQPNIAAVRMNCALLMLRAKLANAARDISVTILERKGEPVSGENAFLSR